MPYLCTLTGLPVPVRVGAGRPAQYANPEAKDLAHRWTAFLYLLPKFYFTPAASRSLQGMFYILGRAVRTVGAPAVAVERMPDPVPPEYHQQADDWIGCDKAESEGLRFLAAVLAAYGDTAQDFRLTRCVVTGVIIYAGTRNPRRFCSPEAAELDLRLQQVRTLLQQVEFTEDKARCFRGELYSLAVSLRRNRNPQKGV